MIIDYFKVISLVLSICLKDRRIGYRAVRHANMPNIVLVQMGKMPYCSGAFERDITPLCILIC